MAVSDEELQAKRDEVEQLRQQVAEATAARIAKENELVNEVTAAELDVEAGRLQQQLDALQGTSSDEAVQAGVDTLVSSISSAFVAKTDSEQTHADTNVPAPDPDNPGLPEGYVTAGTVDSSESVATTPEDASSADATPASDAPASTDAGTSATSEENA